MLRACVVACLVAAPAAAADPVVRVTTPKAPKPAPERVTRLLALLPDGRALALDGADLVWVDLATGKDAARWVNAVGEPNEPVLDPAGGWLLRPAGRSGRWELVDLAKRAVACGLFLPGCPVYRLVVDADAAFVQFDEPGSRGTTLAAFDPATGRARWRLAGTAAEHADYRLAAARGPDGSVWALRVDADMVLIALDPATGRERARVALPERRGVKHTTDVPSRLMPDGRALVVAGDDHWFVVDLATQAVRKHKRSPGLLSEWAVRPDGKAVGTLYDPNGANVAVDPLAAGVKGRVVPLAPDPDWHGFIRYAPDGRAFVIGTGPYAETAWRVTRVDPATGTASELAARDSRPERRPEDRSVGDVAFAGEKALVLLDNTGRVRLVDVASERVTGADWPACPAGGRDRVRLGPVSPTTRTLALGRGDAPFLLDLDSGKWVSLALPDGCTFDPAPKRGTAFVFTQDARRIVVRLTGLEQTPVVAVYEVAAGARRHVVASPTDTSGWLGTLPDGSPAWLTDKARPLDCDAGRFTSSAGRWDLFGHVSDHLPAPDDRTAIGPNRNDPGYRLRGPRIEWESYDSPDLPFSGRNASFRYTPDGRYVVAESTGVAFDTTLWRTAGRLPQNVRAFSPSGKLCAVVDAAEVRVYQTAPFLPRPPGKNLTPAAARAAWRRVLAAPGSDWHALARPLFTDPAAAVKAATAEVKPAAALDPVPVRKLFDGLNAPAVADREQAFAALSKIDARVMTHAAAFLTTDPPAEARRLALAPDTPGQADLVSMRAVEILERLDRVDAPGARRLLSDLADGDPLAVLTDEAKAALARLGRR